MSESGKRTRLNEGSIKKGGVNTPPTTPPPPPPQGQGQNPKGEQPKK